jgi:hypothetical protein
MKKVDIRLGVEVPDNNKRTSLLGHDGKHNCKKCYSTGNKSCYFKWLHRQTFANSQNLGQL